MNADAMKPWFAQAATWAGRLGGAAVLNGLNRLRHGNRYIRSIGYHSVPENARDSFGRQLDYLSARFENVDEKRLEAFLAGEWPYHRPGLILSFDDGLFNNYLVAAPLLERAGFSGWFFVPTGFPGLSAEGEEAFCRENELRLPSSGRGSRLAMSWDELRDLVRRGHIVGCHTVNHRRLKNGLDAGLVSREILDSKKRAEAELATRVRSFAWVGGEPDTYGREAERAIAEAGFSFAFTTLSAPLLPGENPLRIHRTILDADLDFPLFRFKTAGFSDIVHRGDRLRLFP